MEAALLVLELNEKSIFVETDAANRLAIASSGQTIRGIRLNEDTFFIQLKNQQGRFHSFRKSELRDLKKLRGETPMPAYGSVLSAAELDDLINFLASQKGKP